MTAQQARALANQQNQSYTLDEVCKRIKYHATQGRYRVRFGNPLRGNEQRPWPDELTAELERMGYQVNQEPSGVMVSWEE